MEDLVRGGQQWQMRVDHAEQGIERPVQPLPRVAGPDQGRPHRLTARSRSKVATRASRDAPSRQAVTPGQPGRLGDRLHGQALPASMLQHPGRGGEQPGVASQLKRSCTRCGEIPGTMTSGNCGVHREFRYRTC